ncbi:hypothetical protein H5410_038504 [Solanum commersonii]|uniref:Uncharacterized protein n=1 Tax=Solanum commersonii TaxID=4109 RepID=A0A9J5YCH3_SOLCO|nr:hypothetical protein H5410_038504 [Solanum commersonii]
MRPSPIMKNAYHHYPNSETEIHWYSVVLKFSGSVSTGISIFVYPRSQVLTPGLDVEYQR